MLRLVSPFVLGSLSSSPRCCGTICRTATALAGEAANTERERMINKLLYRSRQRGFLELDLLVGLWAEQHVPEMETGMLKQFDVVLDQENPDLFKWLTGQQEAPNELQGNQAYQALKQHVAQQLADSCHEASQAAPGKEWLRGWDDSWRSVASKETPEPPAQKS